MNFGLNLWNKAVCRMHGLVVIEGMTLSGHPWIINEMYTAGWNVWGDWFLAVNHHNHKSWVPSILTHNLWLIFTGMKQFFFLKKKKNQNGRLKKRSFFKIANSQYFLWKFHELVLGLVKLIDVKGIDVAQLIWPWGCPTQAQKQAKMHFLCF